MWSSSRMARVGIARGVLANVLRSVRKLQRPFPFREAAWRCAFGLILCPVYWPASPSACQVHSKSSTKVWGAIMWKVTLGLVLSSVAILAGAGAAAAQSNPLVGAWTVVSVGDV